MNLRTKLSRWFSDYDSKTFMTSAGSLAVTVLFALYNGYLGIAHRSVWTGSICVYYLILVLIRSMVILAEKKGRKRKEAGANTFLSDLLLPSSAPESLCGGSNRSDGEAKEKQKQTGAAAEID